MTLLSEEKQVVVSMFKLHEKDTGSVEVQVAIMTVRIALLTEHLKENKKDHSCRRSLLKMVGNRRRLLKYLKGQSLDRYRALISRLGLKK